MQENKPYKYALDHPTVSDSSQGDPCSFHSAFSIQVLDLINSVKQQLESALRNVSTEITGIGNSLKRDVWWIITIGGSIVGIFCVFVAFMAPRIWTTVTLIDHIESKVVESERTNKILMEKMDSHKLDELKLENRVANMESCVSELKKRVQPTDKNGGGGTW